MTSVETDSGACPSCRTEVKASGMAGKISAALCPACLSAIAQAGDKARCRAILQAIDAPILMMQSNPRLVFTANDRALGLFAKPLNKAEEHRGGEVFNCIHSFTEAGCGKDVNCEECRIKAAIVATFEGTGALGVSAELVIRHQADAPHKLTISSQSVGNYALVRIDEFTPVAGE